MDVVGVTMLIDSKLDEKKVEFIENIVPTVHIKIGWFTRLVMVTSPRGWIHIELKTAFHERIDVTDLFYFPDLVRWNEIVTKSYYEYFEGEKIKRTVRNKIVASRVFSKF